MREASFHVAHGVQTAPIRALRSLTERQAAAIAAGVPAGWEVDRHQSYDGHLSLMITPRRGAGMGAGMVTDMACDPACDAAYTVDGDGRAVRLGRLDDDRHTALGIFAGPDQVLAALVGLLAPGHRAA